VRSKNKFLVIIGLVVVMAAGILLYGCSSGTTSTDTGNATTSDQSSTATTSTSDQTMTGSINVVSREDGSGTRSAFTDLFGVQTANSDGTMADATTTTATITNSTSSMMTTVAGDTQSIGFVSLASLDSTVKALTIDGVTPTAANVKSGTYAYSRPFNLVTTGTPSAAAQDFINFIMSQEGQQVISDNNCTAIDDNATPYSQDTTATGQVVVSGSTSMYPILEKLQTAYAAVNSNVTVDIQTSDSTTAVSSTVSGACDIGMVSRALEDSETSQGLSSTTIATDGIAVIVNNNNPLTGLTKDQVTSIFLGQTTNWEDLSS